jgi:uncharacterized protein
MSEVRHVPPSAFHAGEVELQREAGVAERMTRLGPQVIRDAMPEQHRNFFRLLPFIIVGSVDAGGQPTASLLSAPAGFVSSPDPTRLRIDALPLAGDPLERNLVAGAALGLLGIQPHTRRRNRVNGITLERDPSGFSVGVQQSFGNCPKYIHPREAMYVGGSSGVTVSEGFGERERALVSAADTFFIASAHPEAAAARERSHGVDVSHRGGPPGFALFTDERTFIVPDYRGNNFYNTLGNLRLQPAAGLLFVDVQHGHVLQLHALTELLDGPHPAGGSEHTGRVVRFRVEHARFFPAASRLWFAAMTPE